MLNKVWQWIKTNGTGVLITVLGLLSLFFKSKADKDAAQLQTANADKTDATLKQKQTDIGAQITQVEQQEKVQESIPHTTDENVDFLKKL